MAEDREDVSRDGLLKLHFVAADFARAEIAMIVEAVLADLRSRPSHDTFGDVAARHLWDEYCWSLQEGPFDDDISWGGMHFGSISDAFEDVVRGSIQAEVEKRPKHVLVFLSAKAVEEDADIDEEDALGRSIWMDGIVSLVLEEVNRRASRRNLDLIGPERGELVPYEVEGGGMVWGLLSERGEASNLVASHCDTLLDPQGDLSELAEEMLEAFMAAAANDDGMVLPLVLENFEDELRTLAMEKDLLPMLNEMRASLFALLDR
jgi:hypothetical protein